MHEAITINNNKDLFISFNPQNLYNFQNKIGNCKSYIDFNFIVYFVLYTFLPIGHSISLQEGLLLLSIFLLASFACLSKNLKRSSMQRYLNGKRKQVLHHY